MGSDVIVNFVKDSRFPGDKKLLKQLQQLIANGEDISLAMPYIAKALSDEYGHYVVCDLLTVLETKCKIRKITMNKGANKISTAIKATCAPAQITEPSEPPAPNMVIVSIGLHIG